MKTLEEPALVLNRNWIPVAVTTVASALCKIYTGQAQAVDPEDYSTHDFDSWARRGPGEGAAIRTTTLVLRAPEVIVLVHYSEIPASGLKFSRHHVIKRDRYTCQYCGTQPTRRREKLTIDHVVPKARGGETTWENCVAACEPCNAKKANQTPDEAGMRLRKEPKRPDKIVQVLLARVERSDRTSWSKFVR